MNSNEKVLIINLIQDDGSKIQVMASKKEVLAAGNPAELLLDRSRSFLCDNAHMTIMTPTISKAYDKNVVPCMICQRFAYEVKGE
jgi:hypothetical protein